jgi:protease-4
MRVLRFLFRLLFIALAVLGGLMVALALVLLIGWRWATHHLAMSVPERALLTLDTADGIAEAEPRNFLDRLSQGKAVPLRTAVTALDAAGRDDRVKGIVIRLGHGEIGMARIQELRDALLGFRQHGKAATCFAEDFGEAGNGTLHYYLASACDEIWLQPSGELGLVGFTLDTPFLKDALDKLGIVAQMDHREEFKGAVNSLTASAMPAPQRENMQRLVDSWIEQVAQGIGEQRHLAAPDVRALIDRGPLQAKDAVAAKLVDKLGYRDEADAAAASRASGADRLSLADYAAAVPDPPSDAPHIALVYGVGPIQLGGDEDSTLGSSMMAADATAKALADAIDDPAVKAVVLRIDSPGGSYVAADVIWRQVDRARRQNKPVVVSMGDVAASGGYFIAAPARAIVADPGTLTGSIGVFGGKIVLQGLWQKLGIGWDGVQAGTNAGIDSANRPFTPEGWQHLEATLDRIYADFLARVAAGRKLAPDATRAVAKGQIWTGLDARERGLVDELGGLSTAIRLARGAAGIEPGSPVVIAPFPAPEGGLELLLGHLATSGVRVLGLDGTLATLARWGAAIESLQASAAPGLRLPPLR